MWAYLIQGFGYGLAAAAQPGPLQAYLISRALREGWRRALPAVLAPLISDGPILLVVLLVLSQVPSSLRRGLQAAGGLFVLHLARGAFRAWLNFSESDRRPDTAPVAGVLSAALINVLNPAPYLFWSIVTGPILVDGWRRAPAFGLGFLGSFYVAVILCLGGIVLAFGTARQLGPKVNRALLGASAVSLLVFGSYQLWLAAVG